MSTAERSLLGFFSACWIVALLELFGVLPLATGWALSLYGLYGTGAALGWLAGNVWMFRRRRVSRALAHWLLMVYLFGPPSVLYLLRALAPEPHQAAAPLVPLWAFLVYGIFFLVPVTLTPRPGRPGDGADAGNEDDGEP